MSKKRARELQEMIATNTDGYDIAFEIAVMKAVIKRDEAVRLFIQEAQ
jgi:hypothetical protein